MHCGSICTYPPRKGDFMELDEATKELAACRGLLPRFHKVSSQSTVSSVQPKESSSSRLQGYILPFTHDASLLHHYAGIGLVTRPFALLTPSQCIIINKASAELNRHIVHRPQRWNATPSGSYSGVSPETLEVAGGLLTLCRKPLILLNCR